MNLQKQKPFRSRKYLDNIKSQDCKHCFAPADDPHHIANIGNLSGYGQVSPDWAAMAMCRGDHTRMHSEPEMWESQWSYTLMTLSEEMRQGRVKCCASKDPEDIEYTITFTTTVKEWIRINENLREGIWCESTSELRNMISDLIIQAKQVFFTKAEE